MRAVLGLPHAKQGDPEITELPKPSARELRRAVSDSDLLVNGQAAHKAQTTSDEELPLDAWLDIASTAQLRALEQLAQPGECTGERMAEELAMQVSRTQAEQE